WEARGVRLALDQLLARELGDGAAVAVGRDEAVVLLGGDAGERLEPVRVVRRLMLDRPVAQGRGHRVGDGGIERLAEGDRPPERLVDVLRQARLLDLVVEGQGAEGIRGAGEVAPDAPDRL